MRCVLVIPARYASSRLPGKPLLKQTGKYLVQHVYEQAKKSRLAHEVVIATDDPRIMAACGKFQANCQMTLKSHPSGTDRVAEVATKVPGDIFVNLQGDEPMIDPASIDLLIRQLLENSDSPMATLATPIRSREDWLNPNCVKVVHDGSHRALYFSRSPIPFQRDGEPDFDARPARFLQHIGMYAYRREFLLGLSKIPQDPLEKLEKLEQLRVLGMGKPIQLGIVEERSLGVDTPQDYQNFISEYNSLRSRKVA